jgi:hypothetical protein
MRSFILRGILAAATALTAACSSSDSVAPATPVTPTALGHLTVSTNAEGVTTMSRPVDQYVWVSCANGGTGETIRVTGDLRYDMKRTQDSSGVSHLNIKSNTSNLIGVGLTTGTFFRGVMTERGNSRAEDSLNEDVRIADIIRLVAPGSSESYSLMVSTHIILDEGTYVLWDETWKEVCR